MSDQVLPQESKNTGKHRRWWPWLLLLVVVAAVGYRFVVKPNLGQQAKSARSAADAKRPMPVLTAVAVTGDIPVYLNGLGSVAAQNTVLVKPRVDGQLIKILFTEGQMVQQGALLAEIDPRPYQVVLMQAEGQMLKDQALLENAQIDAKRYQTLFQQDSIAQQQVATQQALVHQYQGAVKADQGQVDSAKLQLAYSRITAPISGRLGLRQVDVGNVVHASDATGLVVITQMQPTSVVFSIPEDNLPSVLDQLRHQKTLSVDAFDRAQQHKLASGVLASVDNQIDPTTGTVKLKAQFANQDNQLFSNQFVNIRMLVDVVRGATIIPMAGVQRGNQGSFVYVVKDDHSVTLRLVTLGPTQGDRVAVNAGLKPGEVVVVDGADKLREGAKVVPTLKDSKVVTTLASPAPDHPKRGNKRQHAAN